MVSVSPGRLEGERCIVIDRLVLPFFIGIHDFEKETPQDVSISVLMFVADSNDKLSEDICDHVSYADVADAIKSIAAEKEHIALVETLAERVASVALSDRRVKRVLVDVRKTHIIPEAAGVGVIMERRNPTHGA